MMRSKGGVLEWEERRRILELQDCQLLAECAKTPLNSSGAGGQKRDRKYSGIRLTHNLTGAQAVSSAFRSRARNEADAIAKMKLTIALEFRSSWDSNKRHIIDLPKNKRPSPAVLADIFDLLEFRDFSVADAAKTIGVSTSKLLKFIAKNKTAWRRLNELRNSFGLPPLKINIT